MGKLRRKTLTIAKGFLWAMVVCAGDPLGATQRFAVAGSVILLELAATGAFSVTNEGHDIELRRDILIEKQDPSTSSWTKLDVTIQVQDIVFSSSRNARKQGIFQLTSHPENRKPLFLI